MIKNEIVTIARRIVSQRNLMKVISTGIQDDPAWTAAWRDAAIAAEGDNPDLSCPTVDRCRIMAQVMVILEH